MKSKHCNICNKTKPVSEFYKKSSSPDGLYSCCKACHRATRRRSYYKNIETDRQYKKEYNARIAANPELRAIRALRRRVGMVFKRKGVKPVADIFELIGCTKQEYVQHLRASKSNLTWCSYTERWVVAHTLPPRTFNLKNPAEQFACFNVINQAPKKLESDV